MSRGVELPWGVFGRPIRPFHLALTISTSVIGYQYLLGDQGGLTGWSDEAVGAAAVVGAALLFAGWIISPGRLADKLGELGLSIAAGVWAGRAWLYLITEGLTQVGFWLSMAWCVGALGAWFLEQADHRATYPPTAREAARGFSGRRGRRGAAGPEGVAGPPGKTGQLGAQGEAGRRGPVGPPGDG